MRNCQKDYAAGRAQMYDKKSREEKAKRIVRLLTNYFGKTKKLKDLSVLDLGASTGIIANYLSRYFKNVVGVDIDQQAIAFAKKNFKRSNLHFQIADAMKLSLPKNSFDVVICTHIYEHVPQPQKLLDEILGVLKNNGVCYLAAVNRLWPIEPHYNLPFLSYFPKRLADIYVEIAGKADNYYETPMTYWGLKKLCRRFKIIDYTPRILFHPRKFGYQLPPFIGLIAGFSFLLAPTFFWLLIKEEK